MICSNRKFYVLLLLTAVLVTFSFENCFTQNGNPAGNGSSDAKNIEYEEYDVEIIPESIIALSDHINPYALVVDKTEQKLYIYTFDGKYHLVKSYNCTTGENKGIKKNNGDKKTPEGVYFFTGRMDSEELSRLYGRSTAAQYGVRAFDTDYPNSADRLHKRRGDGIWLHGTDQPERAGLPNSTRGCVVMRNNDIENVTQYIHLNRTPLIIVDRVKRTSLAGQAPERQRVEEFLGSWKSGWENRDFTQYRKNYSSSFRSRQGGLESWLSYKQSVLAQYDWIRLSLSDVRIFKVHDYYYVEFIQKFETNLYSDYGLKRLYIMDTDGELGIIYENWTELTDEGINQ